MPARHRSSATNVRVSKPTWRFPDSNYGLFQDYNDNQAAHFVRAPVNHLVREFIQNSTDARATSGETVDVSFAEVEIPTSILDTENYREHLLSCVEIAYQRNNPAAADYERAWEDLSADSIPALRIQDAGTTGLSGQNWDALTSSQGSVQKNVQNGSPGGSFGVGKNVAFLFSSIHAVIYSTRYTNRHEGSIQKAIGRSQLMSHPRKDSDDYHQPSGWLDVNRSPLAGREIPASLRLPSQGTAVFILGWTPQSPDWRQEVALRAAQNFFTAIHRRLLRISISTEQTDEIRVDHATVEDILAKPDDRDSKRFLSYYHAVCNRPDPIIAEGPVPINYGATIF